MALGSELIDNHEFSPIVFALIYRAISSFRNGYHNFSGSFAIWFWVKDASDSPVQTALMRRAQLEFKTFAKSSEAREKINEILALEGLVLLTTPLTGEEVNGFIVTTAKNSGELVKSLAFRVENNFRHRLSKEPVEAIRHLKDVPPTGYQTGQDHLWQSLEKLSSANLA